jgi:hypothetical protein
MEEIANRLETDRLVRHRVPWKLPIALIPALVRHRERLAALQVSWHVMRRMEADPLQAPRKLASVESRNINEVVLV